MDILVNVTGQRLKVATNQRTFTAGTQEFIRFVFCLSSDWNGLQTFVQFQQGGKNYNKYLDSENAAFLPPEIVSGLVTIVLQGNYGNTIAKSFPLAFDVEIDPVDPDSSLSQVTVSLYDQLTALVVESEELLENSAEFLEESEKFLDESKEFLEDGKKIFDEIEDFKNHITIEEAVLNEIFDTQMPIVILEEGV